MTADSPEGKSFYTQNEIGRVGELRTRLALEGRQHWKATLDAENTIDTQKIVCKSQVWVPKAHEHKHNLDYLIEAGPCNKCQVPSCEYRHLNPYPETAQGSAAEHRHEVKTNPATHTYTTTGAIKDDGKRFAPTGNLFLEIWQNVKLAKGQKHKPGATYRGKEGWLYQEPLAEWYHFYQPVTTTRRGEKISIIEPEVYEKEIRATLTQDKHEPDEAFDERVEAEYQKQLKLSRRERAKEARRFAKEMTVNDRLIYCRPWPYIVSIRGDIIRELVKLCKKDNKNNLVEQTAYLNGKTSIGYLLPIDEVVNDPCLLDIGGTGTVAFTHLPAMVIGTKPATSDKVTHYLPEKMYHRIFKKTPASKGERKLSKTVKEFVQFLNRASLTAQSETLILRDEQETMTLHNPWARLQTNCIKINSRKPGTKECEVFILDNDVALTYTLSGEATGTVGDAHIKGTLAFNEAGQREPHYQWFGLRPIQKLLDNVKIWPEKH